jgi:hypothetical protein
MGESVENPFNFAIEQKCRAPRIILLKRRRFLAYEVLKQPRFLLYSSVVGGYSNAYRFFNLSYNQSICFESMGPSIGSTRFTI